MNEMSPSPLDAIEVPLHGTRLIEASAGTGKTYNIANLYIRLLLGHGLDRPYSVEEILVVTFTRAATAELTQRIREKIDDAVATFRGPFNKDDFLNALNDTLDDAQRHEALRLLNGALLEMDDASIFTIHGFASRVLQRFPFESGALTGFEVTLGESPVASASSSGVPAVPSASRIDACSPAGSPTSSSSRPSLEPTPSPSSSKA